MGFEVLKAHVRLRLSSLLPAGQDVELLDTSVALFVPVYSIAPCCNVSPNYMFSSINIGLVLEHKPLVFCSGKLPLCLCVLSFSPFSLLIVSVYLVLCGGL